MLHLSKNNLSSILSLGVILLLLSTIFACQPKTVKRLEETTKVPSEKEIEDVEEDLTVEEERIPELLCQFIKSPCYGKCPVYEVKLYSDGRILYEGKANVAKIGLYEAFLKPDDLNSLYFQAEKSNFFALSGEYPTDGRKISDLPSTMVFLKRGGLEKRVVNNFDAPISLQHFETFLEQFFQNQAWTSINP